MRLNYSHWIGSFLAAVLVLTGCRGCDTKTSVASAEVGLEHLQGSDLRTDRNATYDFGTVFRGNRNDELSIVVRNLGAAQLTLSSLELVEGDAVEFTAAPADATGAPGIYYVEFEPGTTIDPAGTLVLPVTFIPAADPDNSASTTHTAKLLLRTNALDRGETEEDESVASITLTGRGVSGQCEIPNPIDFGTVARGDTARFTFDIQNPAAIDAIATVGDITSGSNDRFAFAYGIGSPRGDFVIPGTPSGGEISKKSVVIEFTPTDAKNYFARAEMRAARECPLVPVEIIGVGVDNVLSWSPSSVDCGAVSPQFEVTREVTFTNLGANEAVLTEMKFGKPDEFRVIPGAGQTATSITVPGKGGTATVTIGCKPLGLGNKTDSLSFKTNLLRQSSGSIGVKVFGGGPKIQVSPAPNLTFGKVAYFPAAGANQAITQRIVDVENRGTKPIGSGETYNLRLGTESEGWLDAEPTVELANGDTVTGEFTVAFTGTYDPAVGLGATATDNYLGLSVKFQPRSIGTKAATIKIRSNDPSNPLVTLNVTAEATLLNPCQFSVVPDPKADFGLVQPGGYQDLTVNVTNLASPGNDKDVCLISGIRLSNDGAGVFKLPLGESVQSIEIQPGDTHPILVRAQPTGSASTTVTEVIGALEFYMSVESDPRRQVDLTVAVAQACLSIAPKAYDYGTVQKDCASASKQFSVYNSCPGTVTVHSVSMQNPAGQQVGGPNCTTDKPGLTGCPEFVITQPPTIPAAGVALTSGGAPLTFRARYEPIDYSSDTGAISIQATQNGQPVNYLVTLRGRGDTVGYNEDTFTQDGQPRADILIVIDNSGSMGPFQQRMAQNFDYFLKYATDQGVDYHIGVIHGDDASNNHKGRLYPGLSHTDLWITPATANKEVNFADKVKVGTNGDHASETMLAPSLWALTPPLSTGHNAGFLREEAKLAILAVTDAAEQSTPYQPGTYWLNQFLNIKGFNRSNEFTFNAIAGFQVPGACSYDGGPDDGRFAYLVQQTQGQKGEICTTDWEQTLEKIGTSAFGFRTSFDLNATPDQGNGPIQVFVDGVAVPRTDPDRGTTIWSYDPVRNAVVFDPNWAPEAGDSLTITYTVACNP